MSAAMPKIPRNVGPLGNSEAVKSVPNFRVSFWWFTPIWSGNSENCCPLQEKRKRPAVAAIGTAQRK